MVSAIWATDWILAEGIKLRKQLEQDFDGWNYEKAEYFIWVKFSLKMKESAYPTCVKSAMLCGSETWCLRNNEVCCIVNAWFPLIAALLIVYAIPFNYLSYRLQLCV